MFRCYWDSNIFGKGSFFLIVSLFTILLFRLAAKGGIGIFLQYLWKFPWFWSRPEATFLVNLTWNKTGFIILKDGTLDWYGHAFWRTKKVASGLVLTVSTVRIGEVMSFDVVLVFENCYAFRIYAKLKMQRYFLQEAWNFARFFSLFFSGRFREEGHRAFPDPHIIMLR